MPIFFSSEVGLSDAGIDVCGISGGWGGGDVGSVMLKE